MELEEAKNALTAKRIRLVREQWLKLSTARLAEELEAQLDVRLKPSSITRYEKWETYGRPPPADYLRGLAALAETTSDFLLGLTDDPEIPKPSEDRRRLEFVRGAMEARQVSDLVSRSPDGRVLMVELKESTAGAPEKVAAAVWSAIRPQTGPREADRVAEEKAAYGALRDALRRAEDTG